MCLFSCGGIVSMNKSLRLFHPSWILAVNCDVLYHTHSQQVDDWPPWNDVFPGFWSRVTCLAKIWTICAIVVWWVTERWISLNVTLHDIIYALSATVIQTPHSDCMKNTYATCICKLLHDWFAKQWQAAELPTLFFPVHRWSIYLIMDWLSCCKFHLWLFLYRNISLSQSRTP